MPKANFPITPELTAIAIGYSNEKMIADQVLPRVPVGKQEFKYMKHTMAEGFTLPDTKVGRKSSPNKVDFSATETTDSTEDHGLEDDIPMTDIANAPEGYDPKGKSTVQLTNLIELRREKRIADLVFDANQYGAAYKETLAGNDQWSDAANSDPVAKIMDSLDVVIMRPNVMTIGRAAFTMLARHPKIVKAIHGNSGDSGIARRQDIAELFELDELLVGEGWLNTAKKGQAPNMVRVWGKHCALIHRDMNADTNFGATFGYTAQFGTRIAGANPNPDIGLRGGETVRVGESVKELITANDLAFFLQNVVA
ncbi:MAG TPA: phage capsid protein [Acidiferrobacteraceae bacterium]|nr:phage capsid protein [Acidiferrobacteraceae bacterium]